MFGHYLHAHDAPFSTLRKTARRSRAVLRRVEKTEDVLGRV
jgi:hypothetical protein